MFYSEERNFHSDDFGPITMLIKYETHENETSEPRIIEKEFYSSENLQGEVEQVVETQFGPKNIKKPFSIPIPFKIEAKTLVEAFNKREEACKKALEEAKKKLEQPRLALPPSAQPAKSKILSLTGK